MVRDKENIKKEIKSALRNISILLLSLILINCGLSIASIFKFTEIRIVWTLDYGFFSILLSVLFTIIHYFMNRKKLYIVIDIQNKKEEINQITINDKDHAQINMKVHIDGEYRKLSKPVVVTFPYWIDFQLKPKPYIKELEDQNKCEIDLDYLIKNKKKVLLNETITFDIISNDSDKRDDLIEVNFPYSVWQKLFQVHTKSVGIKIKNKNKGG
jgi:membrane protein implicated in regulation of membrane protease activity